jgi:hypothetical protein
MVISCSITEVQVFVGALVSQLECVDRQGSDDILPTASMQFLATAAGLWMPLVLMDQASVDATIAEPPLIAANQIPARRSFDVPGMFEGLVDRCSETREVGLQDGQVRHACHDLQCKVAQGYGDTQLRTCFSRGRGLESLRHTNLDGPRTTTWDLAESRPPAQ